MTAATASQITLCSNISITLNIPFNLSTATTESADKFIDKHLDEFNKANRSEKGMVRDPGYFNQPYDITTL